MKAKVTLGISISNATKEDVIDIGDEEYAACETDFERDSLLQGYWEDWSQNYIDGSIELAEGVDDE